MKEALGSTSLFGPADVDKWFQRIMFSFGKEELGKNRVPLRMMPS